MNTSPPVPTANLVVLRGTVSSAPSTRELRDGTSVVSFDVTTVVDGATAAVPLAWHHPGAAALAAVEHGTDVVVVGSVRRRFFRAAGATQSRTEVIVDRIVPTRRAKTVRSLLGATASALTA